MSGKTAVSRAKTLFRGNAYHPGYLGQVDAGNRRGVIFPCETFTEYGAITTADADGACASQGVTLNVPALINGALATDGVATFETPRNVVAAWTTAAIMTVTGTDQYGEVMVEASASGTSHTGTKAFKTITQVIFSATVTGATVGEGVVIGLPFRVDNLARLVQRDEGGAITFVAAVTTDPATATTGDVRGTVAFADAPNGTRLYALQITILDTDTKLSVFGVNQYGG